MGDAVTDGATVGGVPSGENGRLSVVVAETEPFFSDVMKVYVDLLCRGDREVSRAMFRSGARFAGAVKGMSQGTLGVEAQAHTALAAKRQLEQCLFALYSAQQQVDPRVGAPRMQNRREGEAEIEARVFERGFVLLSALRTLAAHQEYVSPAPP